MLWIVICIFHSFIIGSIYILQFDLDFVSTCYKRKKWTGKDFKIYVSLIMAQVYCFDNTLPGTWNKEYHGVEFEPKPQIGQCYQLKVEGKTAIFTILNCSQAQIYYRDACGSLNKSGNPLTQ